MRQLQDGFAAHIAGGQTTLATCWRIERRDGAVLGFTDHDAALRFGGTDYLPANGLEGGQGTSKLGSQVDTGEVLGVLSADAIAEDDLALGRYDGAEVQTWRVNWRDVGVRQLMRRDSIGEIVREDGLFRAELRSGQQALNTPQGRLYSSLCDATLGDAACGVDLEHAAFRGSASVVAVRDRFRIEVSGLGGFAENWFGFGRVTWTGGRRDGVGERIGTHTRPGGADVLSFDAAVGDWVAAGDTLTVYAGCDRRFATCREKFANGLNFSGFPHIPGTDFVLRYPRNGGNFDGKALVG